MMTEKDIQQVRNDLIRSGVDYIPLQDELVDHISMDIEKYMSAGKSFKQAYNEVMAYLNTIHVDFSEVQNDTKILLDYKSRALKFLIASVVSITLTGFTFKFFKVDGGSLIQLLSFILLSILFFRFAFHFYSDKRNNSEKKFISALYVITGIILPLAYILFLFYPQYHIVAVRLNMISYLLLSLSVFIYLKTYQELNIFRIEKKTRKADLYLAYINIIMACMSLLLNIGGFQIALHYLLFGILGNTLFGIFYIMAYRFTNRLTGMLLVSIVTMHIYHLPDLIR